MKRPVLVFFLFLLALQAFVAPAVVAPAFAQAADVTASIDETEIELGDTVSYTLRANSTTHDAPSDAKLPAPSGLTIVDQRMAPSHMVSIVNGHATEKHGLTATWTLRSDRLGTFTIGPASVIVGGARKSAPAARVTVVAPGMGKPRARRPAPQPFDPFGSRSPFDPFKGLFPGMDDDDFSDPVGGIPTDPKLALDHDRGVVQFVHATVDKTRAVIGEQVTLSIYLYQDLHARPVQATETHEATAADFVAKSLLKDPTRIVHIGNALVGGRPWAVHLLRKDALFPIKAGRAVIGPMTRSIGQGRGAVRESETLSVDVSDPPIANRPPGYQIGDTGELSLSSTVSPKSIEQHGALGVTVELRGTGNFPGTLTLPERKGVEWLEPQVKDNLGPASNDLYGGTRTFSYVVRIHEAGSIDLGEIRLPYYNPQTRSYDIAQTSLGIVTVAKGTSRDAGADVADVVFANMPNARATLEGAHVESFLTERPLFWVFVFGAPLACAAAIVLGNVTKRVRERRANAAPSADRVARERRVEAEAALGRDDAKAAFAAIGRAVEAEILTTTGVNVRGTAASGAVVELVDAGVPEATAKEVVGILSECESARFSPEGVSMDTARSLWERAVAATRAAARRGKA